MFNFNLYNGSLTTRVFVALTVALCIWSILTMTGEAMGESEEMQSVVTQGAEADQMPSEENSEDGILVYHVHQGDEVLGGDCYEAVYHEHSGSKTKGGGCYGEAVKHAHSGSSNSGGGCYGQNIFHSHTGSSSQGGGCYGSAVYHSHSGSEIAGGGCYGTAVCHTHAGNEAEGGACFATPIYHQHQGVDETASPNGCYTKAIVKNIGPICGTFSDLGDGTWKCSSCGWVIPDWNVPVDRRHWPQELATVYTLGCGITEGALEKYELTCSVQTDAVERYELNCGKSGGTVEWYQLSCGKNESTVETFGLNCGYSEGQVEGYQRNCGMTKKTIVGYKLICGLDEQSVIGYEAATVEGEDADRFEGDGEEEKVGGEILQPVKVPMEMEEDTVQDAYFVGTGSLETGKLEAELVGAGSLEAGELEAGMQGAGSLETGSLEADLVAEETELWHGKGIALMCLLGAVCVLGIWLYFKKTVALFYYDETNHYHSLGRVLFQRTQKGYHVEIGNGIRKKATTDRYRIRTNKSMQNASEKQHLYVRISTQIMKLGLEEYVDFAL